MCRRISPLRNHTQHFVWPSLEIKGTGVWIQLFRIHKTLQISPEFQCFRCAHICYITSGTVNCALTLWEVRSKRNNIWLIRESGAGENWGGWILNSFCWKKPWRLRKWYCYYRCTTEKLRKPAKNIEEKTQVLGWTSLRSGSQISVQSALTHATSLWSRRTTGYPTVFFRAGHLEA